MATEPLAIPAAETVPGSQITLRWNASADYRFIFKLVYDAAGRFSTVMCQIESTQIDFHGYNYFLPLKMVTGDRAGQPVRIDMSLRPGSGIYQGAIWCNINVPDFQFQGVALEFSGNVNTPLATIRAAAVCRRSCGVTFCTLDFLTAA